MNLLTTERLTHNYGAKAVLREVSFSVGERRCIALLGPNGAGKTTTLSILAGLLEPTSGKLSFKEGLDNDRRRWMGFLPQSPSFFGWMTGHETIVTAGRLCGLSKTEAENRSRELLEMSGLEEAANRRVSGYSGGMKQRLGLAQAVVHRPRLLILDEPVSALDPIGRRDVLKMLESWKQEMTILLSTHVLHDAEQVCDDLILMNKGQVIIQGEMNQLRRNAGHPYLKIVIEENEAADQWLEGLSRISGVLKVGRESFQCNIQTGDIDHVREKVLRSAIDEGIKLQTFEVSRKSLEQWFVEAVQI
ncbi:ABC transporter ATP-binding protein [Cohnella abietis]|uniref:Putative ABC transporter ATP-binding protein YxlF n=1 Tax=Cohnella abietis TaxID=2507935 RepID=A0A3T1DAV3_9BACL|nr:ABC transporter ATP-binding protein [Cohnella abietis]BBI35256.1 putative ABC transporter ATP-binding protein YxlF [Cohnella abietis]